MKIVAVALVAAIGVCAVGITAHLTGSGLAIARVDAAVPIIRAGKPVVYTRTGESTIR
jgi:hypothetical protein